ncbi:MAG TPA: hypothetical protein VFF35_04090, partial [Bacteroidia bacterium]|nr:hypothetical protein [Bacteroidia bacterium]
MKKLKLLLLISIAPMLLYSQNNIWSLPGEYYISDDIATTTLPTPPVDPFFAYHNQRANYSHNAMQDAQGNLLFFIVDDKIYDRNGYLIDEMKISGIKVRGSQEICIVPVPGSCTR